MTQIKLNSSLDSVSSNVSVNPSVLFEKEKMVNQESGKVLLLTGITGLGYNLAPHFGMYQIHNYLKHHNLFFIVGVLPHSSSISRLRAPFNDSPFSTFPPGNSQRPPSIELSFRFCI